MAFTYGYLLLFWGRDTANCVAVSTVGFTTEKIYLDKYTRGSTLLFEEYGNRENKKKHYSSQQGLGEVFNNPSVWVDMCPVVSYKHINIHLDVDPFQRLFWHQIMERDRKCCSNLQTIHKLSALDHTDPTHLPKVTWRVVQPWGKGLKVLLKWQRKLVD